MGCDTLILRLHGLTTVTFNNELDSIGSYAFSGCKALLAADLPIDLKMIGIGAFEECHSMTRATLGVMIKELPYGLFYNCYQLRDLYILYAGVPKMGLKSINDPQHYKQVTVHVDADQLANFQKDIRWNKFENFGSFAMEETIKQEPKEATDEYSEESYDDYDDANNNSSEESADDTEAGQE